MQQDTARFVRQWLRWPLLMVLCMSVGTDTMAQKKIQAFSGGLRYLDEQKWNELFPNRFGVSSYKAPDIPKAEGKDFYSFKALLIAAARFPLFLNEGDAATQKRELAAFLANIAQETSGGWSEAPGGYFKWGLCYKEEINPDHNLYADTSRHNWPPVPGKSYQGRGPKQLSWNYNYGQFSEAYFGNKDTLLRHPELLATDPVVSFASAIWFWMTPQSPKPSCHDVMTGKWQPTPRDTAAGRYPGFGVTVNIINGGIECGRKKTAEKTSYRYRYYQYFCRYFGVTPGPNADCNDQKPFTQ
ncbi:chitinase [Chitinophagaceae bacterium MMS25-I14]